MIRISDLAETLVERQVNGYRTPVLVLAHDAWIPPAAQGDVEVIARNKAVWDRAPTPGDHYLAELVQRGYFTAVLQLGAGNSLERALAAGMPAGRYLRLVRGEHGDSYFGRALQFDDPKAKLVKLRGDIIGRSAGRLRIDQSLPSDLRNPLQATINGSDLVWVGPLGKGADVDAIIQSKADVIWWVTENPPDSASLRTFRSCPNLRVIEGAPAAYDAFFRELALQTARIALKPVSRDSIRRINEQVRSKLPNDITYSDQLIQKLAHEIRIVCDEWRQPTLLVYIHDPAAPGGSEVEKRIHRYLLSPDRREPDSLKITVQGTNIRWIDRRAERLTLDSPKVNYEKVVIVDSVSFTGRTLELAAEHVRAEWPSAEIYWAVLIAFQDLVTGEAKSGIPPDHLIKAAKTDRHDIFFPWGWTQATSSIVRHLAMYDRMHDIMVEQRPWGTVEILADQTVCSARLLSIRAGHRLSYHSHSIRDELYVVVDGDVGFEFDSDDGNVIDSVLLTEGEYIAVPRGVRHRFAAYRNTVRLLEIGFGFYDKTFDLERFQDDYGRMGKLGNV
jgi:mannose-6-phosphate isomerase